MLYVYIYIHIMLCYIHIICLYNYIYITFHWPPCDTPHCPLSSLPSWSPAPGFRSPAASRTQRRRRCPTPDKVPGGCWREDISWNHVNSRIETRKYSQTYMYWLYWFLQIAQYLIWCEEFSENVEENYKNLEKQDMKGTVLLGVWFSALYSPKNPWVYQIIFFLWQLPSMVIPGSNRWRYVSTIFQAMFWGYLPWIGSLKKWPLSLGW